MEMIIFTMFLKFFLKQSYFPENLVEGWRVLIVKDLRWKKLKGKSLQNLLSLYLLLGIDTNIACVQNLANKSLVDDTLNKVEGLKAIAQEIDVPLAQMAIAWVAKNPNVSSVITGATKEHQVNGSV